MDTRKPLIFLSASMPTKERDKKFLVTADFIAIRDAVVALVNAIIPHYSLVWGGHPAITPIIHDIFKKRGFDYSDYITIYQSEYFTGKMPKENLSFDNIVLTQAIKGLDSDKQNREESLRLMRRRMLSDRPVFAGVFVGGMEGVIDEYYLLREYAPRAHAYPLASTGGAALILYHDILNNGEKLDDRLLTDYCYSSLFDDILNKR